MSGFYQTAVIGTGLTGLVQAWALSRAGFHVALCGPVPKPSTDDRTTAILMPGIEFLQSLDLWEAISASATPLTTMELIDQSHHLVFDASEVDQPSFGHNISNEALKKALVARLKKSGINWHQENAAHMQRQDDGWTVTLDSGKSFDTNLLIGADGRSSPTRRYAMIVADEKSVDQSALVTILQCEKPHFNTSVEWYLQGGPLTLVPMPKNRQAVVWCNQSAVQQAKTTTAATVIEQELNELTSGRFGTLRLADKIQLWPVQPMKAQRLIAPHCALVGEAAHVLAPIGAQGFNISLHDIIALTRILKDGHDAGLAPSNTLLLHRYEKNRLPEIDARYHSVNALNTTLQSPFAPLHQLRRLSLLGIQKIPFIKKQLMHKGMTQRT